MGDLILADFKSKTYHKPDPITLERLAAEILEQVEIDSTKGWTLQPDMTWKQNEIIPFNGAGIDGMDLGKEPA
jgi:hypothetical protein